MMVMLWGYFAPLVKEAIKSPYELRYEQAKIRELRAQQDSYQKILDTLVSPQAKLEASPDYYPPEPERYEYLMGDNRVIAKVPYGLGDASAPVNRTRVCLYCKSTIDADLNTCPQCGGGRR